MTLAELLGNIPVEWVLIGIVVIIGLLMKHSYYSSGADEIYEKDKREYQSKFGNSQSSSTSNSSNEPKTTKVEETTTTTKTTTTLGQWDETTVESIKEDKRVTYEEPINLDGNLAQDIQSDESKRQTEDDDGFKEV